MAQGRTGLIVHVRFLNAGCVPGVILDPGRSARVRLWHPSSIGPAGHLDHEGDYRHRSDPLTVPNVDGIGSLDLPTWHTLPECRSGHDEPV